MSRMIVAPVRPEELAPAFQLVFQHAPAEDREARVANALRMVRAGELDPAGVLIAKRGGESFGVIVCLLVPGASGLVWPPQVLAGAWQTDLEDQLVQRATSWLQSRGAKLAQAFLKPADVHLARPLERNGFEHITSLWYMRCQLSADARRAADNSQVRCDTYRNANRRLFQETMLRSYDGTLDCPEVNGVRTMEEIIAGHRAQGVYTPDRWWLAWHEETPVGVLLLAEVPEWNSWDVSYVGVVPEARRHGFGRQLMAKAFHQANRAGARQLTLSVDARNQPARELYRTLGFEDFEKREVFLAIWSRAP